MNMDKEKILTSNGYESIFHPFLLKVYPVKKTDYAILPKYVNSDKFDQYKIFSNSIKKVDTSNILDSTQIKDYFSSGHFFLSTNLEINSIDDVYQVIDELITSNRKIETIDLVLNIIFKTWIKEIDDIYIDKFIDFYQKYFMKFYSLDIDYKKMFKQIQSSIVTKDLIHDDIINNILKK
jgi:hypothetical protein